MYMYVQCTINMLTDVHVHVQYMYMSTDVCTVHVYFICVHVCTVHVYVN